MRTVFYSSQTMSTLSSEITVFHMMTITVQQPQPQQQPQQQQIFPMLFRSLYLSRSLSLAKFVSPLGSMKWWVVLRLQSIKWTKWTIYCFPQTRQINYQPNVTVYSFQYSALVCAFFLPFACHSCMCVRLASWERDWELPFSDLGIELLLFEWLPLSVIKQWRAICSPFDYWTFYGILMQWSKFKSNLFSDMAFLACRELYLRHTAVCFGRFIWQKKYDHEAFD